MLSSARNIFFGLLLVGFGAGCRAKSIPNPVGARNSIPVPGPTAAQPIRYGSFLEPAVRGRILDSALKAIQGIPDRNGLRASGAVLAALKSISGLERLQVSSDDCVFGIFSDGVPFSFFNNQPIRCPHPPVWRLTPHSPEPQAAAQTVLKHVGDGWTTAPITDPLSVRSPIKLLDGNGPLWAKDRVNDDAAMFRDNGFPNTRLEQASVEAFRSVAENDMVVLYIASQGGAAFDNVLNTPSGYGIWTSSEAKFGLAGDERYRSDLNDGSLGIAISNNELESTGKPKVAAHYMLLPHFIAKYHWNLDRCSLVSLGCPSSDTTKLSSMRRALESAGGSVIFGWTGQLYPDFSYFCNSYILDRSLGANEIEGLNPPRKSFNWSDSLLSLVKRGEASFVNEAGKSTAICNDTPNPDIPKFNILRPSIKMVRFQGPQVMAIDGEFPAESFNGLGVVEVIPPYQLFPGSGPSPGSVGRFSTLSGTTTGVNFNFYQSSMGGVEIRNGSVATSSVGRSIATPNSPKIQAVPDRPAGEFRIGVMPFPGAPMIYSNSRRVSLWKGQVTDTRTLNGVVLEKAICSVGLRGDVGPDWISPDAKLNWIPTQWSPTEDEPKLLEPELDEDTHCRIYSGGKTKFPDGLLVQYVYVGAGLIPSQKASRGKGYFQVDLGAPLNGEDLGRFRFVVNVPASLQTRITQPNGKKTKSDGSELIEMVREGEAGGQFDDAVAQFHNYNMAPGSLRIGPSEVIQWSAFPCQYPPIGPRG